MRVVPSLQHRPCIKLIKGATVKCPPVCKDSDVPIKKSQTATSPLPAQIGKKSEEVHGHFIWVFDELLDDPELVFAVAYALVEGDGVAGHALVDPTNAIKARYIRDAWNRRTVLASWRVFVKRNVAPPTTLEIGLGVDTLISAEGLAVGTGGSTGRESDVARRPLLPRIIRASLLRGGAWATRSIDANTIADLVGSIAPARPSREGEAVCAGETTRVAGGTLQDRIVRIYAWPTFGLIGEHQRRERGRGGSHARKVLG